MSEKYHIFLFFQRNQKKKRKIHLKSQKNVFYYVKREAVHPYGPAYKKQFIFQVKRVCRRGIFCLEIPAKKEKFN